MIPSALHAAIATTVAVYVLPGDPAKDAQFVAEAINTATIGALGEARDRMTALAGPGREVEVHATSLTPHVMGGAVSVTCVVLFHVVPMVLGAPTP